ncbi:MAG: diaminopimelate epimerase [Nitriliruptorales bacterium]|nr:diaminopimelate epimerase [Nitriliruptorales bacterium]
MEFWKAHGTANDFVVLRDLGGELDLTAELVRALCDRHRGVGADGVLRIVAGEGDAAVFMDYRNRDGAVAEMCGNGIRVVGKHVADHGLVDINGDVIVVGTRAGDKRLELHRENDGTVGAVTVDMGPPSFDPTEVPFEAEDPDDMTHLIEVDDASLEISVVSMGNPHAVTLVDDVQAAPVTTLGPRLETDPRFPKGTNVEFARVIDDQRVQLRVWERGVGETAACGTGACATVVALQRLGHLGTDAEVHLPGGVLRVSYDGTGGVRMTGPAVEVARGELSAGWFATMDLGRPF